jgi:hypothetical protein
MPSNYAPGPNDLLTTAAPAYDYEHMDSAAVLNDAAPQTFEAADAIKRARTATPPNNATSFGTT